MKKLTEFAKNTYYYEIVKRYGNIAIFKIRLEKNKGGIGYDVMHIRERQETKLFDNIMPAAEYGPSNESFGIEGWSYPDLVMAQSKLDILIKTDKFETSEYLKTHDLDGNLI